MKTTGELFSENLKRERQRAGLTQAQLAEAIGMSLRGYQKYEQGESQPDFGVMDLLARRLRCSAATLLSEPISDSEQPIRNVLTYDDAGEIWRLYGSATPYRRAAVLAVLTSDPQYVDNLGPEVARAFRALTKIL